ncbi:hypothetical protein LY76DRAFT_298588 [Colletotrichum caudatum]|nr:hypothetical protein LY76DRAFT_298588 [Colletotrichum caudatum]
MNRKTDGRHTADSGSRYAFTGGKSHNHGPEWWQQSHPFQKRPFGYARLGDQSPSHCEKKIPICGFASSSSSQMIEGADMGFLSRCHFPCTHQNHVRRPDNTNDLPCFLSSRSVHPFASIALLYKSQLFTEIIASFFASLRKVFFIVWIFCVRERVCCCPPCFPSAEASKPYVCGM